jgi:hypothetical protein
VALAALSACLSAFALDFWAFLSALTADLDSLAASEALWLMQPASLYLALLYFWSFQYPFCAKEMYRKQEKLALFKINSDCNQEIDL